MSNNYARNRGVFKRIFSIYAVIMLLAVFAVELYITDAVRGSYITNLQENLVAEAKLVAILCS